MPVTFYCEIPNFTKDNAYNAAIAPFLLYFQVLEDNKKIINEIKEEIKKNEQKEIEQEENKDQQGQEEQ